MNTNNYSKEHLEYKLNEMVEEMVGGGYSRLYLEHIYKTTIKRVLDYCFENKTEIINQSNLEQILKTLYKDTSQWYCKRKRALLCYLEFIENCTFELKHQCKEKININSYYSNLNNIFFTFLITSGVKEKTANNKKGIIKVFFNYLEICRIKDIKKLTKDNVYDFFYSCNIYSYEYQRKCKETIKQFLNWSYSKKYTLIDGTSTMDKIRCLQSTEIQSTYTSEEIKQAILSIDRVTKIGKRDYLVMLLLSFYGLRAGDLLNLKINNIDFEKNQIKIIQQKTQNVICLPLLKEIRYALLDYLKNSRPKSNTDNVFVNYRFNHPKYKNVTTFGTIVTNAFKKANIDITNKHHSSHSLRHSLATNLLRGNAPITSIESILGHSSISSTQIYLKFNFNQLKDLCLEVPYEL
mgnify:CR=1 FL=1